MKFAKVNFYEVAAIQNLTCEKFAVAVVLSRRTYGRVVLS